MTIYDFVEKYGDRKTSEGIHKLANEWRLYCIKTDEELSLTSLKKTMKLRKKSPSHIINMKDKYER